MFYVHKKYIMNSETFIYTSIYDAGGGGRQGAVPARKSFVTAGKCGRVFPTPVKKPDALKLWLRRCNQMEQSC